MNETRNAVCVSAPGRIHCGLFAVGDETERRFGGLGIMIRQPRSEISVCPTEELRSGSFSIHSRDKDIEAKPVVFEAATRWLDQYGSCLDATFQSLNELPCEIKIDSIPARHSGFGSGTQIAFATAAALFRFFELPLPSPSELAPVLGRGARSAIGTFGFYSGGLLVDRGNTSAEPLAPLDFQIDFPESWPIVIAVLTDHAGLSGRGEKNAFGCLPATSRLQQQQSIGIVQNEIIPAVAAADYARFAPAIYELGFRSGTFFQKAQGGPYNGAEIAGLTRCIRGFGIEATGQSSWGPAVFAIAPDESAANALAEFLGKKYGDTCRVFVTRADNEGAKSLIANT